MVETKLDSVSVALTEGLMGLDQDVEHEMRNMSATEVDGGGKKKKEKEKEMEMEMERGREKKKEKQDGNIDKEMLQ